AILGEETLEVCPGTPQVLEANLSGAGHTYTWYKDGKAVFGPALDASTYTVDTSVAGFEGDYAVEISGSGVCKERSTPVALTTPTPYEVVLQGAEQIVLLPSQQNTLSVSTTANDPSYQWYKG